MLSRNEVARDYAYNRALFMRVAQGWYQFNPQLAVRHPQGPLLQFKSEANGGFQANR